MKWPVLFKRNKSVYEAGQRAAIFSEQITVQTSGTRSTPVSKTASLMGGLVTNGGFRELPNLPFAKKIEFYMTVGKIQNVVDAMVLDITNREWFFKDTTDGGKGGAYSPELKLMEQWGKSTVQVSEMLGEMVRNWLVCGVHILSPKDWQPIQLRAVMSKIRDENGVTDTYVLVINGKEEFFPAKDFFEIPYIALDVAAWGVGLYDAISNNQYVDVDGQQPNAPLEIYRQTLQDQGRILHKFASPRTYYAPVEGQSWSKDQIDNDITPAIEATKPGDRGVIPHSFQIIKEDIDGKARFTEYADDIQEEVEAGLQSSKNRLLTEPSAMADAREAGEQDDDRILGLMNKITVFMNKTVIPAVLGIEPGWIEFQWGEKDAFHLEIPPALAQAIELNVLSPEEVRQMLIDQHEWNIPKLTPELQRLQDDRLANTLTQQDLKNNEEALKNAKTDKDLQLVLQKAQKQLEELK